VYYVETAFTIKAVKKLQYNKEKTLQYHLKYCHISNAKNNCANAINTWIGLLFSYGLINTTVRRPKCTVKKTVF